MSSLRERVHKDFETLRQKHDELRVQIDLGKMEAADAWHDAEEHWHRLEAKVRDVTRESKGAAEDMGEAFEHLFEEARKAFARVTKHL